MAKHNKFLMEVEKVIKAPNSRTRRRILKILSNGPKNVKEISRILKEESLNLKGNKVNVQQGGYLISPDIC